MLDTGPTVRYIKRIGPAHSKGLIPGEPMNKKESAFNIGYEAAKAKTATPFCHNVEASALLKGNKPGDPENVEVMSAYYDGIDKATEEELLELMRADS